MCASIAIRGAWTDMGMECVRWEDGYMKQDRVDLRLDVRQQIWRQQSLHRTLSKIRRLGSHVL